MTANAHHQQRFTAGGRPDAIWRPRRCQWIEAEPSPREDCKCLRPVQGGSAYCPQHAERAHHRRSGGDDG